MKVTDYVDKNRILLNFCASDKQEAIQKLSLTLKDASEISDYKKFMQAVFERENLSSTGIGKSVAIPHARTDAVNKFIIAIGRLQDGIDFNALDSRPVQLIFLMGTPQKDGINQYLKILAHLTRLLKKDAVKDKLLEAKKPEEIITAFAEFES
ncbi:MAG: PTS sugar transporter subunit IIA [bacterium]